MRNRACVYTYACPSTHLHLVLILAMVWASACVHASGHATRVGGAVVLRHDHANTLIPEGQEWEQQH
eukprot:2772528-Alexandrium_andersonii.AAC.2